MEGESVAGTNRTLRSQGLVGLGDLHAQCFNQESTLPRARLLEDLARIVQQTEVAAIDVRPLLAAAHELKYRLCHVRIAVDHLVVAAGHEEGRTANEWRRQIDRK